MPPDLPDPERPLRIGTRGSPLALAQAHEARDRLMAAHGLPEVAFAIVVIRTTGDRVQDRALSELGGKGLFTREIEEALADGRIDIAVHSMKDMPTLQPDGLAITALLPREDVARRLRRRAGRDPRRPAGRQRASAPRACAAGPRLLHRRPDLAVVEFRGSVETRLRKLADGVAAATFLAMAGLRRLGLDAVAAGSDRPGRDAARHRAGRHRRRAAPRRRPGCRRCSRRSTTPPPATALAAERAFLAGLDGSCQTPIAGLAELDGDRLRLRGEILRPDGSECLAHALAGAVGDAAALGAEAAAVLRGRAGPGFFDG